VQTAVKLSDYVVQFIADLGVKHVFMLPGGGAMHLNDSLGRCKPIEYICNLHEQASAIAAENYAKATGHLGVCMVTTGPGGTNTVTGVVGAWLDSTPCLFVSGQVKRPDLKGNLGVRQVGVQEVDIVSIVRSITKYAVTVTDPATIRYHLERAVYLAQSGRPGPVWIDVPLDVQASDINPDSLPGFDASSQPPLFDREQLAAQVARTIELLNAAERPVLLAGNGIRLAHAIDDFVGLAELLELPIMLTWLAIDLVPDSHRLYAGRPGSVAPRGANFTIQNADFLLTIGARLDMVLTAYAPQNLARAAKKVMVDIDRAELSKMAHFGAKIDLPIQADAKAFLTEMVRQIDRVKKKDRSPWMRRCADWKNRWPIVLPEHRTLSGPVSTYFLAEALEEELSGGESIVSGSSGSGIEVFLHALRPKQGQRIFHTTALGAMGFGLPAAIGACLGGGRQRTICVDGDGGIQMNIQELQTVARLQLPIKFFILNNNGFSSIRTSQQSWFAGRLVAADPSSNMTLPDVLEVAKAYGVATARIHDQSNLREDLRRVLQMPGPVVCDVISRPDEARTPRVSSSARADGTMVSKPLEDMFPFLEREEFLSNMLIPPLEP
jgi:acetolactate synthase I/II/III large subunit